MVRLGLNLPTFDPLRVGGPPRFVQAAQAAERTGFDAVWVGDHLSSPAPVYEASVALAAVAAVTARVNLGFGVMLLGLRQPAWVAKQLVTLDALAPGRLLFGIGVGGEFPEEFSALGLEVGRRGRLLDDALTALPNWLCGRSTPALSPTISHMPPIWVGGRSDAALERAARTGDGWLATWTSPARPRPALGLAISVLIDANEGRAREQAEDYIQAMYGMPFERVERYTPVGSLERVAERLRAYIDVGVTELVLTPLSPEPLAQVGRLAELRELISRP